MTLEELTRNPASAAGLPKTELAVLLVQCAAAMSAIGAAILDQPEPERLNEDADDQMLQVDEAVRFNGLGATPASRFSWILHSINASASAFWTV